MATASEILNKAVSFIGTKESPPNSNNVIFNTDYYGKKVNGSAYPWCCTFIWDIFKMCNASNLFCNGEKVAYCPTVESWAKNKKIWYKNTDGQPGDLCLMDFGKGRASHIGVVEKENADGSYVIVEGNTSISSDDNGGSVMRRTRYTKNIRGFARPEYTIDKYTFKKFVKQVQTAIGVTANGIADANTLSKTVTVSKTKNNKHAVVKPIQKFLNFKGYDCGTADSVFGTKTYNAVITYQKSKKLTADGIVGKNTWKKLLKM